MMRYGLWNLVARRKTILWELLPTEPVDARLEPWWVVHSAVPTLEAAMEALRVQDGSIRRPPLQPNRAERIPGGWRRARRTRPRRICSVRAACTRRAACWPPSSIGGSCAASSKRGSSTWTFPSARRTTSSVGWQPTRVAGSLASAGALTHSPPLSTLVAHLRSAALGGLCDEPRPGGLL